MTYFIGVDVGTGSARAGVFDSKGTLISTAKHGIKMYGADKDNFEQSSDDVWKAVCYSVKEAMRNAELDAKNISGLGFDATCSLVVIGEDSSGLPVGSHNDSQRNIIVWMDHRAKLQADRINAGQHAVLDFVGKTISPEMQTPKLLWLKENLPDTYYSAHHFFDLTDFLTWKATKSLARSLCTTTCKWTYLAHENRWDDNYFQKIELGDLANNSYQRIGSLIQAPGTAVGQGLTAQAAAELGLVEGTPVGAGLIDAHAGAVGSVGCVDSSGQSNIKKTLAYVLGTSACTLMTTDKQVSIKGVWGPYYSAMLPNSWLLEGGQSAAGAAIDQLIKLHPAYSEACDIANKAGKSVSQWISDTIKTTKADSLSEASLLATDLTVVPEFLGNRSPLADSNSRAIVSGLSMDNSLNSLFSLYIAGVLGLGYGLKQILIAHENEGIDIDRIVISGGAGSDPLVRTLIADSTGCKVVSPTCSEPVLLGSAIIGALASGAYDSMSEAMSGMSSFSTDYEPASGELRKFHQIGYDNFYKLQSVARDIRR